MADRVRTVWGYRVLFLCLGAAIVFVRLLPLHPGPGAIPGPDILMLLALAWVVLRPELLPVWLLAAVFLMADVLFMRPLGLWAALVLLGTEFLRSRAYALRDASFFVEWLVVSLVILAMTVANGLILGIFAVDQPTLGLTLIRMLATILAYPLVVILGGRAFGLKKLAPGETDRLGQRV